MRASINSGASLKFLLPDTACAKIYLLLVAKSDGMLKKNLEFKYCCAIRSDK